MTGSRKSQGLSTGAKAGIGVGASLAGLATLSFAVFLCLKRKKPARAEIAMVEQPHLASKERQPTQSRDISEMDGRDAPSELP